MPYAEEYVREIFQYVDDEFRNLRRFGVTDGSTAHYSERPPSTGKYVTRYYSIDGEDPRRPYPSCDYWTSPGEMVFAVEIHDSWIMVTGGGLHRTLPDHTTPKEIATYAVNHAMDALYWHGVHTEKFPESISPEWEMEYRFGPEWRRVRDAPLNGDDRLTLIDELRRKN